MAMRDAGRSSPSLQGVVREVARQLVSVCVVERYMSGT